MTRFAFRGRREAATLDQLRRHLPQLLENALTLLGQLVVPKPRDRDAASPQVLRSLLIVSEATHAVVLPAIEFDRPGQFAAKKVQDEAMCGVLPAKLEATKATVAKEDPQGGFRVCRA
jgi:hypothetical protein